MVALVVVCVLQYSFVVYVPFYERFGSGVGWRVRMRRGVGVGMEGEGERVGEMGKGEGERGRESSEGLPCNKLNSFFFHFSAPAVMRAGVLFETGIW